MNTKKRVAIYVRVSTNEQNTLGQEAELKEYAANRGWQVTRIYRDVMSGAKNSRPALNELMVDSRKRRMDVVLCWKFDRFARSVSHLLNALEEFRTVGIEFVSVSEAIDTTTPAGRLVYVVLGAVAELERSLIAERVRMGVQNARKRGKRLGRPPIRTLTPQELAQVRKDRKTSKLSLRQLAKKYGASVWAIHQACSGSGIAA